MNNTDFFNPLPHPDPATATLQRPIEQKSIPNLAFDCQLNVNKNHKALI